MLGRSSDLVYVPGDLKVISKLYIGKSNPGGGEGDKAYLEYVAVSGEQTVLKIVTQDNSSDHINLLPSGNVGIKTNYPSYTLHVNGTVGATSYSNTSDSRIKENVTSLDDTFTVDNLNPVTYTNTMTLKQDVGLIAHELQAHFPYLVNGIKDGEQLQAVNYIGLIGILIKEIKSLKAEIVRLDKNDTTLYDTLVAYIDSKFTV